MQNSSLRFTHWYDGKITFSSRLLTWCGPVARLSHGLPKGEQADKGLSDFEVLPRPLHLKNLSHKMT